MTGINILREITSIETSTSTPKKTFKLNEDSYTMIQLCEKNQRN